MRTTVYAITLSNGLKFKWIIAGHALVPVIEFEDGHIRSVSKKNKVDSLLFCCILDAVMLDRWALTYLGDDINENSASVTRDEMEIEEHEMQYSTLLDWNAIVFGGRNVDLTKHQAQINNARRSLA